MERYSKICVFLFAINILFGCNNDSKKGFVEYYSSFTAKKTGAFSNQNLRVLELNSELFDIDTIYRSMKGPISEKKYS